MFCFFFFTVSILFDTGSVFINLSIISHARAHTHTKVRIIKNTTPSRLNLFFINTQHALASTGRWMMTQPNIIVEIKREREKEKLESD